MKMAPVIAQMRMRFPAAEHVVVHTGQHYDRLMSDVFFDVLGLPAPDHHLAVGSASHAVQTARIMERIEPLLELRHPLLVFVPGDVNSTLAATLVAAKLGIPVAHIESGLRSFDRTMPEEVNRVVTDELSEHLFLHCADAVANLRAEGIADERMHFVGNTMIDSLVAVEDHFRAAGAAHAFDLKARGYVLVTLHRPVLVDGPLLRAVLERLGEVARVLPVLFPVHPRTRKMLRSLAVPPGVRIVDPVGYVEFLSLEADAAAVLTDSGGVQEETTFLGVPCFTLRDNTERPVTIRNGTNTLLGLEPARIPELLHAIDAPGPGTPRPPLWDGHAAERVTDAVATHIDDLLAAGAAR
jgi:UDP-N-acetylglucosamine 2-epimerase (non-hydrolysing)